MCSSYYMYILQDLGRGQLITWCWMSVFWISNCNMWNTCTLRHVLYTRDYRRRRRLSDSVNCNMATFAGCVNGWIMEFKWGATSSRIHGIYKFHSSFFFINHPRAILYQVEHRYICSALESPHRNGNLWSLVSVRQKFLSCQRNYKQWETDPVGSQKILKKKDYSPWEFWTHYKLWLQHHSFKYSIQIC